MTIDLRTGTDYPPRREDYCTKMGGCRLADPGTPYPLWHAFLDRVTASDKDMIGFLQRFLGYCLTGHVHEHVLLFLYGTGSNGKSVFTSMVAGIFGDYALTAPIEMFIESRFDRHPTEIARLKGVRLVLAQETQKGRRWDEAKIKNLTGGDMLTARFMHGDFFDFKPMHKLLISGNHKPSLRNVDEAIRRRLLLVPFTVTIPENERDRDLTEKLKAEWPAILRWMLDGCGEWRRVGLGVPQSVRKATDEYLSDQDIISQWIEDWVVTNDPTAFATSRSLFTCWKHWCEERNFSPGTEKSFVEALADHGYEQQRKKFGRGFKGITLKGHNGPDQDDE
jgi:putative DNA primase/helicase